MIQDRTFHRFFPSSLHQWLMAGCVFSLMLLALRIAVTGTIEYIFLPWNLLLAWVPYFLTRLAEARVDWLEKPWKKWLLFAGWLLFVPNAFYILTDLFHFTRVRTAPRWFDLLMLFSFAWNGILFGLVSLRRMEQFIRLEQGYLVNLLFTFVIMWLNALGVYIGRFLRFNSWDVLADPLALFIQITGLLLNPVENWSAWAMTITYACFMTLLYFSIRKMNEPAVS